MRTLVAWIGVGLLAIALHSPRAVAQDDKRALAMKAHEILKANCYKCHGQDGTVEGGLNFVLDFKALVGRKKVIPGDTAKSKLYKRLTSDDNPMPPEDEKVRPSKDDIALLKKWIEAGAADFEAASPQRTLIAERDVMRFICDDLEKIEEAERRFIRYFTISNLYNAGLSEDELQTYRHGLSKLVNSLSWGKKIVVPQPIDPAKTVLRIDLRDYKWTTQVWTRITGNYPYAVILPDATSMAVYAALEWDVPCVRADWFVYEASRPPLYHWVLQLPRTDRELEKELKVDVAGNLDGGQVARAGFNGSGISRHNRLIERHESPYGAYWKSYDFASSAGKQNLFAYPFGPGLGQRDFQHDGGEIIFTLPNGLQAYMLVDGKGLRINEGPTKIVSDPRQPDKSVVNGISCMSCHAKGLVEKDDQLRDHVAKNRAGFNEKEASVIRTLYPARDKFAGLIREDQARFKAAVEKTGARVTTMDPIVAIASRFDQEMDVRAVAAESCLTPEEFTKRLGQSANLSRTMGTLNIDGGTVQRRVFQTECHEVFRCMGLGNPRTLTNSIGMKLNFISAGQFMMGSTDDDEHTRSNERPRHLVRITKPFYMGTYAVTQEQFQRVLGKNPSWFVQWGSPPDFPVDSMSWDEAVLFCKTLSNLEEEKRAGRRYRLPTEAEWEYACRAGTTTRFSFGDLITNDLANYDQQRGRPMRGGIYPPNRWGLYDMHGNIWNLCSDWIDGSYYERSPINDPQGPPITKDLVKAMRGGAYAESLFWTRSGARSGAHTHSKQRHVGFRVVCVPEAWATEE